MESLLVCIPVLDSGELGPVSNGDDNAASPSCCSVREFRAFLGLVALDGRGGGENCRGVLLTGDEVEAMCS
jgi:hypothetical protein